jgi:hypothetical protein
MLKRPALVALLDFSLLVAAGLVAATMVPAAASPLPTPAPAPGSRNLMAHGWCTSNMSVTTLPGLKLLWTGGMNCKSGPTASVDIYDPITTEVKPAGQLTKARYDHSALRLSDGRILIVGGEGPDRQATRDVEIYDPSKLDSYPAGSIITPRCLPVLTQLLDGEVLVTGRSLCRPYPVQVPVKSIELYNPRTGYSRIVGEFRVERYDPDTTLLKDGRVLFTGGVDGGRKPVRDNEIYDPATATLTAAGAMTANRCRESIVSLPDGSVLFAGGAACEIFPDDALKSAEIFDPLTNQFQAVGEMRSARFCPGAALLKDGRVLLAAGAKSSYYTVSENTAELYDPKSRSFTPTGKLTMGRSCPAAELRPDGTVLIQGGFLQVSPMGMASSLFNSEIYDPVRGEFTAVPQAGAPAIHSKN